MIRFAGKCLVILSVGLTTLARGAEVCPAINCDCSSLPDEQWVKVCAQHESRIKKSCAANANTPKDYCLVHGVNAKPLPLAIQFSEFSVDRKTDTSGIEEKIRALYWAIKTDTTAAGGAILTESYPRALQILKLIDSNIDNLFEQQQQLSAVFIADKKEKKVRGSWKEHATGTHEFSTALVKLGTDIAAKTKTAASAKEKKIFNLLSQKTLRMAGKGLEHSAFAYGQAEKHQDSAKAWKSSADVAVQLSDISKTTGGSINNIKFAEFQAAARLHRASYHWLLDNDLKDSQQGLRESQLFVDREGQKTLENLVEDLEATIQEEISGR